MKVIGDKARNQLAETYRDWRKRQRGDRRPTRAVGPHLGSQWIEGKLDGALTANGSATLSIYRGAGAAWADTGVNRTVKDRASQTADSGDTIAAVRINGEWRPVVECTGTGIPPSCSGCASATNLEFDDNFDVGLDPSWVEPDPCGVFQDPPRYDAPAGGLEILATGSMHVPITVAAGKTQLLVELELLPSGLSAGSTGTLGVFIGGVGQFFWRKGGTFDNFGGYRNTPTDGCGVGVQFRTGGSAANENDILSLCAAEVGSDIDLCGSVNGSEVLRWTVPSASLPATANCGILNSLGTSDGEIADNFEVYLD